METKAPAIAAVTSRMVRKSLHTQLEESAAAKGVGLRVTSMEDGRLAYVLSQHGVELHPVTPGTAADMLGVVWP